MHTHIYNIQYIHRVDIYSVEKILCNNSKTLEYKKENKAIPFQSLTSHRPPQPHTHTDMHTHTPAHRY